MAWRVIRESSRQFRERSPWAFFSYECSSTPPEWALPSPPRGPAATSWEYSHFRSLRVMRFYQMSEAKFSSQSLTVEV